MGISSSGHSKICLKCSTTGTCSTAIDIVLGLSFIAISA